MSKMKKIALLMALLATAGACNKDDLNPDSILLGMGGDAWERTEFDDWLYEEFTIPYNIDVKYKWDPFEVNVLYNFAPVDEEKAKMLMTAAKKVWIEPYEKKGGPDIIKRASPKRYVLVGSLEYTSAGGATAGTAEGTNKITIFNVNTFDITNDVMIKDRMSTIHHEYGHTLAANILYPEEWKSISKDFYVGATWSNSAMTDAAAMQGGFVSRYARANPDEDWAETISEILTNGREWFNKRVSDAGEDGGTMLRAKESILVGYMKTNWGIDFYETSTGAKDGLVDAVQEAIAELQNSNAEF
jgi:substrate import-associated zinc metallohydrolase lipoprotein